MRHLHVIPRFEGDAITKAFEAMLTPNGQRKATRKGVDKIAKEMEQNPESRYLRLGVFLKNLDIARVF